MNKSYNLLTLLAVSTFTINIALASASDKRPLEEEEESHSSKRVKTQPAPSTSSSSSLASIMPCKEDIMLLRTSFPLPGKIRKLVFSKLSFKDINNVKHTCRQFYIDGNNVLLQENLSQILKVVPYWKKAIEDKEIKNEWNKLTPGNARKEFLKGVALTVSHLEQVIGALDILHESVNKPSLLWICKNLETAIKGAYSRAHFEAFDLANLYAPDEVKNKEKKTREILSPLFSEDMSETIKRIITRSSLVLPFSEVASKSQSIAAHQDELFINEMEGYWRQLYIRACVESSLSEFQERFQAFFTLAQTVRNAFVFTNQEVNLVEGIIEKFARYQIFKAIMLLPLSETDNHIEDIIKAARLISSHQSTLFTADQSAEEIINILWGLNNLSASEIDARLRAIETVQFYLHKDKMEGFPWSEAVKALLKRTADEIPTYGQAIWHNQVYLAHGVDLPSSYGTIIEACTEIPAAEISPRALAIFQNLTFPLSIHIRCDWEKVVATCIKFTPEEITVRAKAFREKINIILFNINEDENDRGWWDLDDRAEVIGECLKLSAEQIRALPDAFFKSAKNPGKITKFLKECIPLTPAQIAAR